MNPIDEIIEYHTGLFQRMLQTIYEQGIRDGRKQAAPTKAKLLAHMDMLQSKIKELEAQNAKLRKAATQ